MAAQAQQIVVRSGDHSTFSRVTVAIPETQLWEMQHNKQEVVVAFPGFAGSFDLQDVFLRMRRDRIADISADNGSITLRKNCPCEASVFRSGSLLVIDVADPNEEPIGSATNSSAALRYIRPPIKEKNTVFQQPILPWIGGHPPFAETGKTERTARDVENSVIDRNRLLTDVQEDLVEKVANAASSGLLEISNRSRSLPAIENGEVMKAETTPKTTTPQALNDVSRNLRITSSMDQPNRSGIPSLNATSAGATCPDEKLFSVEEWGGETDFSAQIGPARNALMDARDRLDIKAAKNLAELYIYFGFGAETLDVLGLDPELYAANVHLAQIATILEHGAIERPNRIGAFTDCSSDVAMWASLSFRTVPSGVLIDTNATLRALNKLPMHLRFILAPALSERLLQYGDHQSAATALRSIERLPDDLATNAIMAQADLVIEAGEIANESLEDVIAANTEDSPAALVKLVKGKLADDQALSPETASLVEAYAQELRGTEIGNQLLHTRVLALSQSEQFAQAFDALEELSTSLSPRVGIELHQAILERLVKRAPDITFLEHMFTESKTEIGAVPDSTKLLLASRLMDLGFATQAQELLTEIPDDPKQDRRQILAARAAIALMQPFQAQAALIGMEGQEAEVLLAEAKEMTGSYAEAAELFRKNDSELRAMQASWLSDQWRDLTEPTAINAIATLAQPMAAPSDLGPLGQANMALEESNSAKQALQTLLADPILQISPDP